MLAIKWFSIYLSETLLFFILNFFGIKKFKKINFYVFLNVYFNLYKNSNFLENFSKEFNLKFNSFNIFLFLYLIWNSYDLVRNKFEWFLLAQALNSKDYKFQKKSSTSNSANPYNFKITQINSLNFLKKNFFKIFSVTKFEKFVNYNFINFPIKFKPSNILFFLSQYSFNKLNINFIRKSKVFNKGRYSRNRQYYRTGVYWCLYVNIVAVVGLYFWFYRFLINFSYLWWLLLIFILSFVFSKFFNIYKIGFLKNYIREEFFWIEHIITNFFNMINFSKINLFFCDLLLTKMTGGKLFFFYLNN